MMAIWAQIKTEWNAETLTIYLRSGARIVVDRVTHWTIENKGNEIVGLRLAQSKRAKCRLLVKTVDLSQIVAVVASPP